MSSINTTNVTTFQYAQRLLPDASTNASVTGTSANWWASAAQTAVDMFAQITRSDVALLGELLINGRDSATPRDDMMRSE